MQVVEVVAYAKIYLPPNSLIDKETVHMIKYHYKIAERMRRLIKKKHTLLLLVFCLLVAFFTVSCSEENNSEFNVNITGYDMPFSYNHNFGSMLYSVSDETVMKEFIDMLNECTYTKVAEDSEEYSAIESDVNCTYQRSGNYLELHPDGISMSLQIDGKYAYIGSSYYRITNFKKDVYEKFLEASK